MIEYFLPMILILGLYSSYTDIKTKKVSNKIIALSLIYAFSMIFFLNIFTNTYILGVIIAVLLSLALWYANLWPAGDAKMFISYSTLVPFLYDSYFGWAKILIVLFVPLAIVYIARSLTRIKNYKEKLKQLITLKYLAENIITLLAIILISSLFVNILASIFISVILRVLIKKALKRAVIIGVIAILFVLIAKPSVISISVLQSLILAFIVILILDVSQQDELSKKHIPLAPFMFLAVLVSILVFSVL